VDETQASCKRRWKLSLKILIYMVKSLSHFFGVIDISLSEYLTHWFLGTIKRRHGVGSHSENVRLEPGTASIDEQYS
jgi:hypothetical protein